MYPVITFPAVKIIEFKGSFMEESEICLKFYGKIGGVMLAFNAFGSYRSIIKGYGIKPNQYLSVTAEIMSYKGKNGQQMESYKVMSAIPVMGPLKKEDGNDKLVLPTVYFPSLKVNALKQGDATTGRYYRIYAEELLTHGGLNPKRSLTAWSDGMAEIVEKLKVRSGSQISAVAQVSRWTNSPEGVKIEYTLLSFEYLANAKYKKESEKSTEKAEEAAINEPNFDEEVVVIEMPEETIEAVKPVNIEYDPNEFEELFC